MSWATVGDRGTQGHRGALRLTRVGRGIGPNRKSPQRRMGVWRPRAHRRYTVRGGMPVHSHTCLPTLPHACELSHKPVHSHTCLSALSHVCPLSHMPVHSLTCLSTLSHACTPSRMPAHPRRKLDAMRSVEGGSNKQLCCPCTQHFCTAAATHRAWMPSCVYVLAGPGWFRLPSSDCNNAGCCVQRDVWSRLARTSAMDVSRHSDWFCLPAGV